MGWLGTLPADTLFQAAIEALRAKSAALDTSTRAGLIDRIVADCQRVAAASGGVLGLGSRSAIEQRAIEEIAHALRTSKL